MTFLRVMGDNRDERFELGGKPLRAGRAMSNEIRLDDPKAVAGLTNLRVDVTIDGAS